MMDDRELALIAVFRLHEVASRLNVLARVSHAPKLKEALLELSARLADGERLMSELRATLPTDGRIPAESVPSHESSPAPVGASRS